VGAVVKTATEGASATAKGVLNDIEFIKRVDAASPGLDLAVKRIATNHNLTTARLV
jgi:type VI protein secretion system component Hcp